MIRDKFKKLIPEYQEDARSNGNTISPAPSIPLPKSHFSGSQNGNGQMLNRDEPVSEAGQQ